MLQQMTINQRKTMRKPNDGDLSLNDALLFLAYDLTFNHPMMPLHIWWARKYNQPLFHSRHEDYLQEELLLEWYIDRLVADPEFKKSCEFRLLDIEQSDEAWLTREMKEFYKQPDTEVRSLIKDIIH